MRAREESADLKLVSDFFRDCGLRATRFTKKEIGAGKTPDFRIRLGEKLFAYCEVKSPRDQSLQDAFDRAVPGQLVGDWDEKDPVFNRLGRLVLHAAEQFDAVNPDRVVPNILVLVNYDEKSGPHDLQEVLTGYFHADDGTRHPTMMRVAQGEIRDPKRRIDLYIWMDGATRQIKHYLLSETHQAHCDALCAALCLDDCSVNSDPRQ